MVRLTILTPALLAGLMIVGGCSEYVKNTGEACLVPKELQCSCLDPEEEGLNCEFDYIPDFGGPVVCTGTYPADVSYEIQGFLYEGGQGYSKKEKCKVNVDGSTLSVTSSFWHGPERDAIVEPGAFATCEVGPLAAGTYTLEFGGNSIEVEIGDPDLVQEMACVESMKQHSAVNH